MKFLNETCTRHVYIAKLCQLYIKLKVDVEIHRYLNGPSKPLYGCSTLFNKMSKPGAATKTYFHVLQISVSCVGFFYCVTILN